MVLSRLIDPLIDIAERAGRAMLVYYQKPGAMLHVEQKANATPVTQADFASHDVLVPALADLTPQIPILSEEDDAVDADARRQWQSYWCIDPLDGTKEFIAGTGDFCICIALIERSEVTLGLIYLPLTGQAYYAMRGEGAFVNAQAGPPRLLKTRAVGTRLLRVTVSRRHASTALGAHLSASGLGPSQVIRQGSAIKFTQIAEGNADVYPCVGKTQYWDSAAGQLIVEEAGGQVIDASGQTLRYPASASTQNPRFIAVGDPHYAWGQLLQALA